MKMKLNIKKKVRKKRKIIKMKLASLFSGGKDSVCSAYLAKEQGNEIACLITILSENKESYMFHTPSIEKTRHQAKAMNIPLIIQKTKGKKEEELKDLEEAIKLAKERYKIEGVISGALASNYQKLRIENICKKLNLKSLSLLNPFPTRNLQTLPSQP